MIPTPDVHYQLSTDPTGHCLHHTKCFSPNDAWIVFDNRNTDPSVGTSSRISAINCSTREVCTIYEPESHSVHGPGVGAVSFSPVKDDIIFIHGLRNCNEFAPYAFNRRTAAIIRIDQNKMNGICKLIFPDARNIVPPYTAGALRGGTHAHQWDNNGTWISFTYDDFVMDQVSARVKNNLFKRTVGVMIPDFKVELSNTAGVTGTGCESDKKFENHDGSMFSFIVAKTTPCPKKGTDEIDTAFDEAWIGNNGYLKPDGKRQQRAIAFQGNVLNDLGNSQTDIFVADLPEVFRIEDFTGTEGTEFTPPLPPAGIFQRRITFTPGGIKAPRHWLRTTPDGSQILFLNQDENEIVQLYGMDTNGIGSPNQITFHQQSIEGPFNISHDGRFAAYIHQNTVTVTNISDGTLVLLEDADSSVAKASGAVIWSNSGKKLAYNRFVKNNEEEFLQIFIAELK